MTQTHRQILLDAARSIQMLLARNSARMEAMSPEVVKIHEQHLTNLKTLLQYDLTEPNFQLEIVDE